MEEESKYCADTYESRSALQIVKKWKAVLVQRKLEFANRRVVQDDGIVPKRSSIVLEGFRFTETYQERGMHSFFNVP